MKYMKLRIAMLVNLTPKIFYIQLVQKIMVRNENGLCEKLSLDSIGLPRFIHSFVRVVCHSTFVFVECCFRQCKRISN